MPVSTAISELKNELPQYVCLVAVSKTKPNSDIMEAYNIGHRDFGENKVQDICKKWEELPKDIKWHFIGHLQTNKVKYLVPFVHLIHGVDSVKLLKEIDKRAKNEGRVIDCLLQIDIADEETKFGLSDEEANNLVSSDQLSNFTSVNVRGLMGMATNTDDVKKIKGEFGHLKALFDSLSTKLNKNDFDILSMGMTGDYKIAVEEGSNMVRIGSLIFGERN